MSGLTIGTNSNTNPLEGNAGNTPEQIPSIMQRVHNFVMTHSVLWIGLGTASAVVSCAIAFFIAEIALIGIIPSALLIILGAVNSTTSVAVNNSIPIEEREPERTTTAVVGIPNRPINNGWVSAVMQLVMNTPSIERAIVEGTAGQIRMEPFRQFIAAYRQAQADGRNQMSNESIESVREAFNRLDPVDFRQDHDYDVLFDVVLFDFFSALPTDSSFYNTYRLFESEEINDFRSPSIEQVNCMDVVNNGFVDTFAEGVTRFGHQYVTPPQEFVLEVDRRQGFFYQLLINVPVLQEFDLPTSVTVGGDSGHYECNAFFRRNNGHIETYIKRDGVWWHCNDENVAQISSDQVQEAFEKGSFYYFKKAE